MTQIRKTLAQMNLLQLEGFGYVPAFNNDSLAQEIQNNANMHIVTQIITPAKIRNNYRLARKC